MSKSRQGHQVQQAAACPTSTGRPQWLEAWASPLPQSALPPPRLPAGAGQHAPLLPVGERALPSPLGHPVITPTACLLWPDEACSPWTREGQAPASRQPTLPRPLDLCNGISDSRSPTCWSACSWDSACCKEAARSSRPSTTWQAAPQVFQVQPHSRIKWCCDPHQQQRAAALQLIDQGRDWRQCTSAQSAAAAAGSRECCHTPGPRRAPRPRPAAAGWAPGWPGAPRAPAPRRGLPS